MIDLDLHLSTATLPERTVPVCLRGDLTGALKDAEARLAAAQFDGDDAALLGHRQAVQDAKQAVSEAALPFRLRGIDRLRWTTLVGEHAPREDDTADRLTGFDRESFLPALVRECLVDPKPSDAQWAKLTSTALTFGQWDKLVTAAMDVSRHEEDIVPFSSAGSEKTGTSAARQKQRAASA